MIVTRPSFRWVTVGVWLMPLTFAATAVCLLGAYWREVRLRWQSREVGWLPRTPVGWLWWLLMALGGVSTLNSVTPAESIFGWLAGLGYAITFVVASWTVITPGRLKQLHRALFGLGVAMSLLGLLFWALDVHFLWHHASGMEIKIGTEDRRINSVMYHPNLLAGYLVLALGAGLGLFHQVADWPRKAFYAGGLAVTGLCLILTASRAGWFGAAFMMICFGLMVDRRWLLALGGTAATAVCLFPEMVSQRLASLAWDNPAFDKYRLDAWMSATDMIRARPLTGWGPGTWATVYPHFRMPDEIRNLPHAHNYFLHVGAEFGVPVVVVLLLIVFTVLLRGARETAHTQYHLPVLATASALMGHLVCNMFDYTLSEGRNAMAFFLLLGGVEAARRMALADRPPELRRVVPAATAPLPEEPSR
ncbi:MAG: O-antigen polymerase [Cyanobacteria bacterium RYN_339]|nr:O-antigen polymerase [Cyanobacteria bacterium RYN_339]